LVSGANRGEAANLKMPFKGQIITTDIYELPAYKLAGGSGMS
jgi:hypothetical protein